MTTLSPTSHGLIGIRGGTFTASVSPWGDITPHDGTDVLAWHIADEDRWHSPEKEASVRYEHMDKGLDWARQYYPELYMKLLD